ncbi:hypothetical protein, partial [Akkermansia sp.]|uniref:hypothetical protein n=1 Tax=Akkermansia sp. TaxID=1872421 RepID=UPI003AAFFAF4
LPPRSGFHHELFLLQMQEKASGRLQLPQAAARGHTGTRTAAGHGKDVSRPDSGYRLHDIRTSEGRAGKNRNSPVHGGPEPPSEKEEPSFCNSSVKQ